MKKIRNSDIISAIQNGNEDIMFFLVKKYYQSARRWLRRKGVADRETPAAFSKVLLTIYKNIRSNSAASNIDFESYLFNSLKSYSGELKAERKSKFIPEETDQERLIATACFSILDEQAQKILAARYSEQLSFEQIAGRFEFSNPVIAQVEVNKAYLQLKHILEARINPVVN